MTVIPKIATRSCLKNLLIEFIYTRFTDKNIGLKVQVYRMHNYKKCKKTISVKAIKLHLLNL